MMTWLDDFFRIRERGSTIGTEIFAGITTFLTVAYILVLNPLILSNAGLPAHDVFIATAVVSAAATLMMGLTANFPFAVCPGMGMNAFFAFTVVLTLGVSWQVALTAVFIEGVLFAVLVFLGLRHFLYEAIPSVVKISCMAGIGFFLAMIGFNNSHLIVGNQATLVTLGHLTSAPVLLTVLGILLIGVLMALRITGAILIGILTITLLSWITGIAKTPEAIARWPAGIEQTTFQFDFSQFFSANFITIVLSFLCVHIFDNTATHTGVSRLGGLIDDEGKIFGSNSAYLTNAGASMLSGLLGTSTATTYIESASGMQEGGRTGLTAVVIGCLFILALFLAPVFQAIPAIATAPALIVVGAMMMRGAADLEWNRIEDIIPAFLTIAGMAFTYSIMDGMSFGIISYTLIRLGMGKWLEIHPFMYILTALLIGFFALQDLYFAAA